MGLLEGGGQKEMGIGIEIKKGISGGLKDVGSYFENLEIGTAEAAKDG